MGQKTITETVYVKIKISSEDITQVAIGNSLPVFNKLMERYKRSKESYENQGYIISSEDLDKFSFQTEKTYAEYE